MTALSGGREIGPNMPAPQALKTRLLALLDEAYDADGVAIAREAVSSDNFLSYDDSDPDNLIVEKLYKLTVDASNPETITIKIRPATAPLVWPD